MPGFAPSPAVCAHLIPAGVSNATARCCRPAAQTRFRGTCPGSVVTRCACLVLTRSVAASR
ncbi:hypothetical protein C8T65DRAFT_671506 [Cerioporus squamosus]|nr:hypothetical protein C8T65DRAFT_671506 [Cerioporus squamosus]